MNVADKIKQAIDLLEQNEQQYGALMDLQSQMDKKVDFWLHYIELENVKVTEAYKIIKEIKKVRQQRRIYKNDFEILKVFKDNEQKMVNASNRQMLLAQICKTDNKQKNAKYNYEAYTEKEVKEILGIKEEEE